MLERGGALNIIGFAFSQFLGREQGREREGGEKEKTREAERRSPERSPLFLRTVSSPRSRVEDAFCLFRLLLASSLTRVILASFATGAKGLYA